MSLGGAIRSTALAEGPYVWVAPTTGGQAYKLNAATGATVCSASISDGVGQTDDASPVIATPPGGQTTVYFAENDNGTVDGPVTAINEADCSVDFQVSYVPKQFVDGVWDFLSYAVDATGEPLVLFGTADPDAEMFAIDAVTGAEVWSFHSYNPPPRTYDIASRPDHLASRRQRLRGRGGLCGEQVRDHVQRSTLRPARRSGTTPSIKELLGMQTSVLPP